MRFLIPCLIVLALAPAAAADRPLIVGVTEDGLKYEPAATAKDAKALGIDAVRITLTWRPGLAEPDAAMRKQLDDATSATGLRVVLSVFGEKAAYAPQTEQARDQYCGFLAAIVKGYQSIRDVVVWNEPNKELFWQPQFDASGKSVAPAAYEALLARCYDELHAARADVNVLAPSTAPRGNDRPNAKSNVSHSPVRFLEELGAAYRAGGRDRPIFDTLAHHVYGNSTDEAPGKHHEGTTIGEGDYAKLVAALRRAFGGTKQPVPGPIWYLEAGFQTTVDGDKAKLYTGAEIAGAGIPPTGDGVNQAGQLTAALRLAASQPHVGAYFNFLLWDEARLEGWQSGLYWTDRTPKPSVPAFEDAVCAVQAGCGPIHSFTVAEPEDSHTREVAGAAVAAAILGAGAILLVSRRSRRRRISR